MPFNTFAEWQLAGDLLPGRTKEQILATAFMRLGQRTTENGAIDEEWRAEYTIERANTVGAAFLGLTTGCARCHDHKYDPITQYEGRGYQIDPARILGNMQLAYEELRRAR